MKKTKIAFLITIIAVLGVTLAGCSNTPAHKILTDRWADREVVTYDVVRELKDGDKNAENNVKILGTQTMTTERINTKTINIGERVIEKYIGTLVTIDMTLTDGSYLKATLAFDSTMRPTAVSKELFVKGYANNYPEQDITQTINSVYDTNAYNYKTTSQGAEPVNGSVKLAKDWMKSPYFDTLQLYHLARSSFSGKNDGFASLAFKVPSASENALKDATMQASGAEDVVIADKTYKTTKVAMQYTQKFPGQGKPIYAWYNNEDIPSFGKFVLIKFQEGDMTYTFKSIAK